MESISDGNDEFSDYDNDEDDNNGSHEVQSTDTYTCETPDVRVGSWVRGLTNVNNTLHEFTDTSDLRHVRDFLEQAGRTPCRQRLPENTYKCKCKKCDVASDNPVKRLMFLVLDSDFGLHSFLLPVYRLDKTVVLLLSMHT
ncbi:hypothetical protein L9F63_009311, partial [Diploptera punctata]